MPQLSYVKVIVGCPASDVFVTLTTHRNQGTGGILPPQILVGIKAKISSSKDLRLLFFPSDFQIFLRPCYLITKEYMEEAQCAKKGGRMLIFVICGFIKNFFPNFYFILQIYHVKSFKMMHITSLYFNFSSRYS